MKKLVLSIVLALSLMGFKEAIGGGCCEKGAGSCPSKEGISVKAILEEARTALSLTDSQVDVLKMVLENHGIKSGAHVCSPMTERGEKIGATPGGCCAAKKEASAKE